MAYIPAKVDTEYDIKSHYRNIKRIKYLKVGPNNNTHYRGKSRIWGFFFQKKTSMTRELWVKSKGTQWWDSFSHSLTFEVKDFCFSAFPPTHWISFVYFFMAPSSLSIQLLAQSMLLSTLTLLINFNQCLNLILEARSFAPALPIQPHTHTHNNNNKYMGLSSPAIYLPSFSSTNWSEKQMPFAVMRH